MKTQLLQFTFALTTIFTLQLKAQSQGPNDPAVAFDPAAACLACPGGSFMNPDSVFQSDGNFSSLLLRENGFCFQSMCFQSRFLFIEKFGFSIPSGSVINGVEVNIERKGSYYGMIEDSVVQLVVANNGVGNNKASFAPWSSVKSYANYGGASDLWGATLTVADVNDTAFGVAIKVKNNDTTSRTAFIDHVRMKVYYTNLSGMGSSDNNDSFHAFYNSSANSLSLKYAFSTSSNKVVAEVYNMVGQLQASYKLQCTTGECVESIPVGSFAKGVYFVKVTGLARDMVQKIVMQ